MLLRTYQTDAVLSVLASLKLGHNPAAMLATGTGKSLISAELCSRIEDVSGSAWVVTHVQQLVQQNAKTYELHTGRTPGVVCAGLNRCDVDRNITFGTIQSMIRPTLEGRLKPPSLIIVDEAHRVPHKTGEAGLYEQLFRHLPRARRVGMTATPWRTDDGLIYGKDPERFWFDTLAYKYTVTQAVQDGWLSPLVGVESSTQLDLDDVSVSDDFNNTEVTEKQTADWMRAVASSLIQLASKRKHIAVYCPTIVAAMRAAAVISQVTGWSAQVVSGSMSRTDRAETLQRFRSGEIRVLCSVDTLTTGWDMPALDCLACLRPTVSSSLWVQMMGRLTRLHDGKRNGLLLDYVGNLQRLGGCEVLETFVRQAKPLEVVEALPTPVKPREPRRVLPGVISLKPIDPLTGVDAVSGSVLRLQVHAVSAVVLATRRDPKRPVLMVSYTCTTPEHARIQVSHFVNTENPSPADRDFFVRRRLALTLPLEARKIMWMMKGAPAPVFVTARKSGKYFNLITEEFQT